MEGSLIYRSFRGVKQKLKILNWGINSA